ncbi:MAG: peptidoglycan-binding protein [Myxococcota bacterium]
MGLLQRGSRGDEVTALQKKLAKLGFKLDVDGVFGKQTADAVTELQSLFGYTVDGLVGDGTSGLIDKQVEYGWNRYAEGAVEQALKAAGKEPGTDKALGDKLLRKGATGTDVWALQASLKKLGYDQGYSGEFDDQTAAHVEDLQSMFGYTVDKLVGDGTKGLIKAQIGYGWNKKAPDAKEKAQKTQGK